jgi:hypothetical protein
MTLDDFEKKQKKYEKSLIRSIKQFKWMRWSHIDWKSLDFSRATAYLYHLDKLDTIKECFSNNRNHAVNYLVQKWIASDNPTLQIAVMRIVAEEEDRQRLNQQYIDHTSKGERLFDKVTINIIDGSDGDESIETLQETHNE